MAMNNMLLKSITALCIFMVSVVSNAQQVKLADFLSDYMSEDKVVDIQVEPQVVYLEEGKENNNVNFDFVLSNLTDNVLQLRFIKVAVYDQQDNLLSYRYLNHNGVGTPGIHSLGNYELKAKEQTSLYNPFFNYSKSQKIGYLRFMFTYVDMKTKQQFYYGNIVVTPTIYQQKARLTVPLKGLGTILDGHDYFSHHRRFSPTIVRNFTHNQLTGNFSRYALGFVSIGKNGSLRQLPDQALTTSFDFKVKNAKIFYTDQQTVYSPGDGEVIEVVNDQDDLYDSRFNMKQAIDDKQVKRIAGNFVVIRHNTGEYSHLFHLLKGSIIVSSGQKVKAGQSLGLIGFSGAATTYSHLHYQLMNGSDFTKAESLPVLFSDVTLLSGDKKNGTIRPYRLIPVIFICNKVNASANLLS